MKQDIRKFIIYRVGNAVKDLKYLNTDLLMNLAERWSDKLDDLDLANIGGSLLKINKKDESIYFLRLSTNKGEKILNSTAALNLAVYYAKQQRSPASFLYYSCLPDDKLEKENSDLYELTRRWEKQGIFQDSLKAIQNLATQHVYNNAVNLLRKGHLKAAEEEFIAAGDLGFDSRRIKVMLEHISRLKDLEQ